MVNLLIIIGVLGALALLTAFFYGQMSGSRDKEMKSLAEKLGFAYKEKGDGSIASVFSGLYLFRRPEKPVARNILLKNEENFQSVITDFDWFENIQAGKPSGGSPSFVNTIVGFDMKGMNLPEFVCTSGGRMMRYEQDISGVMGNQLEGFSKVDFEVFSDFSKKYVVYAKNKTAVFELFNKSGFAAFVGKLEGINVEGKGNLLIAYQGTQVISLSELPGFYDNAKKILNRLKKGLELPASGGPQPH